MMFKFLTLDDLDLQGKTVFLRVDINSPIDPSTGRILDDFRIRSTLKTLRELSDCKVVLGSHQSRPGKRDFTSLREHAKILRAYHGGNVKFVEDVIGPAARKAIRELEVGEVLVLENLRFHSEEVLEAPPEELARTIMVRTLAPYFDAFVNDAFAAAHRSQPSLVGFAEVLPSAAGRLMEKELQAAYRILESGERPRVFVLGGAKVKDRLKVIEHALRTGVADSVLLGGRLCEVFLAASGRIRQPLDEDLRRLVGKAKAILEENSDRIRFPVDVATEEGGLRYDVYVEELGDRPILDIGINTTVMYAEVIEEAGTVVASGPMGMFEKQGFDVGTREILKAMAFSKAYTVVGGGHMASIAFITNLSSRMSHVSTGGGALLTLLSGRKLPAVEALVRAAERMKLSGL